MIESVGWHVSIIKFTLHSLYIIKGQLKRFVPKLQFVGTSCLNRKVPTFHPHTFSSGLPKGISCPPKTSICLEPSVETTKSPALLSQVNLTRDQGEEPSALLPLTASPGGRINITLKPSPFSQSWRHINPRPLPESAQEYCDTLLWCSSLAVALLHLPG